MSDSRLLDIARQGDPRAIGTLLNAVLLSKRVKATVVRQAAELMITLHSEKMLNQGAAVTLIRTALEKLHLPEIQRVFIESRVLGVPLWESHFRLEGMSPVPSPQEGVEDPWRSETITPEPCPPEPTLLDLMSAFMASPTAEAVEPISTGIVAAAPSNPKDINPAAAPLAQAEVSDGQDTVARSPQEEAHPIPLEPPPEYGNEAQERFLNEFAEIDPEEDMSLADLAAAFDPNPAPESPQPRESPELNPDPLPIEGESTQSDPLGGVSKEVSTPEASPESLSSPPEEGLEAVEETIATADAAEVTVANPLNPTPPWSEATLGQPTLEEGDVPEPTTEDIVALEDLGIEISPQPPITTITAAESAADSAIAPAPASPVEDPWAVSAALPSVAAPLQEPLASSQDPEIVGYPPLRDPWLESDPVPPVKIDKTQQTTPPPDTATASSPPPSESEIYTIPTIEKVPRDGQSKVAGLAGMVMGLGFCATGLGTIIGLPMVVGGMWMLGDEEVWCGECPHCHQQLKIPVGKLWRFSCDQCQGLIEVKHGRFYGRQAPPAAPSA